MSDLGTDTLKVRMCGCIFGRVRGMASVGHCRSLFFECLVSDFERSEYLDASITFHMFSLDDHS